MINIFKYIDIIEYWWKIERLISRWQAISYEG